MIFAAPSEPFTFSTYGWVTGLEGTIGYTIRQGAATIAARATDGIEELVAGSGVYEVEVDAAPSAQGTYTIVIDDADGNYKSEDLLIAGAVPSGPSIPPNLSPRALCTIEDVVDMLGYDEDQAALRQNTIVRAINSASAAIARRAQRDFIAIPLHQVRYSLIEASDIKRGYVRVGDMQSTPSEVALLNPDRSSDDVTVYGSDEWWPMPDTPDPGFPFEFINIISTATVPLSSALLFSWLRVTADWGFPEVPDDIIQCAIGTSTLWIMNDVMKLAEVAQASGRRLRLTSLIPDEFLETVDSYRLYRVA